MFLKHAIIRNKKGFYRMDGRPFYAGLLFQVVVINDIYDTTVARMLNGKSDEYIRIDAPFFDNFECVTGII